AAAASASGRRLADARVTLAAPVPDPSALLGRPTVNLRHFPNLSAGRQDSPAVHELVMAVFDDLVVADAWIGEGELEFPPAPGEELDALAPQRTGRGFRAFLSYTVSDLRVLETAAAA
ncbi:MAG: acetoacetate decarboxylase family protein, partial [Stackebrandtia sp.]